MKLAFILLSLAFAFSACTPMKRAQTSIARGIGGNKTIEVDGHEVYCSQGRVCSEIDVIAVSAENKDYGSVRVKFKNRTGDSVLVKVKIEVLDKNGNLLDETRPENHPIPPTQESAYEIKGLSRIGAHMRILLNAAN